MSTITISFDDDLEISVHMKKGQGPASEPVPPDPISSPFDGEEFVDPDDTPGDIDPRDIDF